MSHSHAYKAYIYQIYPKETYHNIQKNIPPHHQVKL